MEEVKRVYKDGKRFYQVTRDGEVIATLYISPYNKKNSERPPKGFKLSALP